MRPRGQTPAELYLSSSGVGEREGAPPGLEAAVEETGSGTDAQNYSFPANSVLAGFFEPGTSVCLLCTGVDPQLIDLFSQLKLTLEPGHRFVCAELVLSLNQDELCKSGCAS